MRILYDTGANTPVFVLADSEGRGVGVLAGPSAGGGSHARSTQVTDLLRADSGFFAGRKNRKNTVTWTSSTLFANLSDAWAHRCTFPETLPDDGRLYFEIPDANNQLRYYQVGDTAVLQQVSPVFQGLTVYYNFSFVGGKLVQLNV